MRCMKCGKDTVGQDVFCEDCLAIMEKYPVKPGTPVTIPSHAPARRYPVRKVRAPEPEEIIHRQKKLIRLLCISSVVLLLAWALAAAMVVTMLMEKDASLPPIGQNFGVSDTLHTGG